MTNINLSSKNYHYYLYYSNIYHGDNSAAVP